VVEESNIDEFIGALRRAEVDEIETAEEKLKEELKRAESEYETELQGIENEIMEQVDTLTNNHNEELGENVDNFQQILSELEGAAYHWDEEFWQNFSPNTINEPAECHRIGILKINGHFNQLETLALIPIINGNNVILLSTFGSKVQMKQGFQSLILRLLITSPKNQIRLVIVDSSNEYDGIKNLFPNRTKDISRIESKFEKIIHHLFWVRKEFLKNGERTLIDVASELGHYPVPHYILAIADFPHTFSEKSIRQLMTIMQKGPACGIHTVMMVDYEEVPDLDLEGLDTNATVISHHDGRLIFGNMEIEEQSNEGSILDHSSCYLDLDQLPKSDLLQKLVAEIDDSVFEPMD